MDQEKAKELFGIRKNEEPRTKFVDNISAVDVRLADWPDPVRLKRTLIRMAYGSWFEDPYAQDDVKREGLEKLERGEILAQGLEHPRFCFLVSGLSLHGTHALVRNRIGICYMQMSQAVRDLRHDDVLVPRAFTKNPVLLKRYKWWCEEGKKLYAALLDSGEIANTDARFALPRSIPNWIYVSVNLVTLRSLYGKRSDSQEEHPEMNRMAALMRREVVSKFPWMDPYFRSDCDRDRCLHQRPGYEANCIFRRDSQHGSQWSEQNWTLHDKTKRELMLDAKPYSDGVPMTCFRCGNVVEDGQRNCSECGGRI